MLKIENRKIKLTDDGPFEALRILASIFIALCATFIVLCLVSQTPVDDFVALLTLPLENSFNFGYVLVKMVPLTFAAFVITASVSDASYNWAVVRGLSPFIAMGMQVPGFVVEYLDPKNVDNGYILYTLLTMFVVMLVCGLAMSHYMRKNRMVINENGMVVLE